MRELAVGVIGTGGMGTRHSHNLHHRVSGARVAAVYDLDQERARQAAAACDQAQVFGDPLQLIADAGVDALVIASPDPTHAALARACLEQRKPALCEKPLATTAADAEQIVATECAIGRRLISLGFMRRFDPPHNAVKQAVESGAIGRPVLFKGLSRNPMIPPDLPADIIMINSVIHDLDSTRWLLGQEVTEVFVRGVRTRPEFGEATLDLMMLQMALTGGCLASVEAALAVEYGYEIAAEVVGVRGTAETMQPDAAFVRSQGRRSLHVAQDWLERFQPAYVAELQSWVSSLLAGQVFGGASAWDGYMSVVVAEACVRSIRSGAPERVPTPEMPDLYR